MIRVRDTGVGIAPEMLPRIWEMYTQADSPHAGGQDGLGIGLAVTRRLVELHDGRIDAYSDGLGKGAEFVVMLPVLSERAEKARPSLPDSAVGGCARGGR